MGVAAVGTGVAVGACRQSRSWSWAGVALTAVVAVSLARKQRLWPVWTVALGYAVACQIPIYLMRSSRFTALELAQTLRYLPDLVVVLALLCAVGFCAPNRMSPRLDASPARTVAVVALCGVFVASSLLLDDRRF